MADQEANPAAGRVGNETDLETNNGGDNGDEAAERRKLARRVLKIQKIFAADVTLGGEEHNCFLHVHDLNEGGMRIHTDFPFPDGQVIPIRLYLDEVLALQVQTVWQKRLLGGMHVLGLKFITIADDDTAKIQRFLDKYSPESKRKNYRLNRVLVVEMILGETRQKLNAFTLDLSASGMRIAHEFTLPEEIEIPFRILLEYDLPPIEVVARVAWQKETSFDRYLIGLEFTSIDEDARKRIEQFIDSAIAGRLEDQVIALHLFEEEEQEKQNGEPASI